MASLYMVMQKDFSVPANTSVNMALLDARNITQDNINEQAAYSSTLMLEPTRS